MMKKILLAISLLSLPLFGTPATLHLRYGAGPKIQITGTAATTPITITTATAHGFTPGQVVWVWGVSGPWNANGTRRVKTTPTSTTFTIVYCGDRDCTVDGADAATNGVAFRAQPRIGAWVGPTLPYTLAAHPRLWTAGHDARLKDPDGAGAGSAPKAVAGNPPWDALTSWMSTYGVLGDYAWNGSNDNIFRNNSYYVIAMLALRWYSDNSQTAALDGAKYWLSNAERISETLACDETASTTCGNSTDADNAVGNFSIGLGQAYSLIYDQLSSPEKTRFAGMMLNDRADGNTCNPMYSDGVGTVTALTSDPGILYGTGTNWLTTLSPGDTIRPANSNPRIVVSVDSDTQIHYRTTSQGNFTTTSSNPAVNVVNQAYKIAHPWQAGDCGWAFFAKHGGYSPLSPWPTPMYPVGGGKSINDLFGNQITTKLAAMLNIGLATADDDPKGARLAEGAANWFEDFAHPLYRKYWTGTTQIDSQYGPGRFGKFLFEIWQDLKNATGGAVDYSTGRWMDDRAMWNIYEWLPTSGPGAKQWALAWGRSNQLKRVHDDTVDPPWLAHLFSSTTTGAYLNYFMRNIRGDYDSTKLTTANCLVCSVHYVFGDPAFTQTDYRTVLPTARAFIYTDVMDTSPTTGSDMIISRTGFSSASDTVLHIHAPDNEYSNNHLGPSTGEYNPGTYVIFKNQHMLAGDAGTGIRVDGLGYTSWDEMSNYMEVGGAMNLKKPNGTTIICDVDVPRFSGGTGAAENKFMYALVNSKDAYTSAAALSRLHRHFIDFKGGSQQFIVVYDDVATSSGKMKRTFLHYPHNGQTGEGTTTFDQGTNSISSLDATGGAKLLTKVLFPGNSGFTYVDNANGTYTGGVGQTFRVSVCAGSGTTAASCDTSNTQAEFLTAHMPTMDQGATMPAVGMISSSSNVHALQIEGSSPKVAVLAKGGVLVNSASFVSTHTGTAQIVVAGLSDGSYTVVKDGSVLRASQNVPLKDHTLYLESTAGTFDIIYAGAPCEINTSSLPSGTTSTAYSQPVTSAGCIGPLSWSISAGSLPAGLSIDGSTGVISGTPSGSGTSSFTVRVQDNLGAVDTQALSITINAVTLNMVVTPTTVGSSLYGTGAATVPITISASGGTLTNWSASDDMAWLTLSKTSGTGPEVINATIDATGLAIGVYTGTITVTTSNNVITKPRTIAVTLSVTPVPAASQATCQDCSLRGVVLH